MSSIQSLFSDRVRKDLRREEWLTSDAFYNGLPAVLCQFAHHTDEVCGYWFYYRDGRLYTEPMNRVPVPTSAMHSLVDTLLGGVSAG